MEKIRCIDDLINDLKNGKVKVGENVCIYGTVSKKDFGTRKLIYTVESSNAHITCFDSNLENKAIVKLDKPLYLEGEVGYHLNEYTIDKIKVVDSNIMKQHLLRLYEKEKTDQNLLYLTMSMGDDEKASEIVKSSDGIDPNGVCNNTELIFFAVEHRLPKTFKAIVGHKDFNGKNIRDGFDEPILVALLYIYGSKGVKITKKEIIKEMIDVIISSNKFDLNEVDINETTALSVACEFGINSVVKALCDILEVDVNIADDYDRTPLDQAIKANNYEAVDILMSRSDLKVTKKQKKLIEAHKKAANV